MKRKQFAYQDNPRIRPITFEHDGVDFKNLETEIKVRYIHSDAEALYKDVIMDFELTIPRRVWEEIVEAMHKDAYTRLYHAEQESGGTGLSDNS